MVAVPVAPLEPFVRGRWAHHAPAWLSEDPVFTHAHITVLAPWVSSPSGHHLERVRRIAAARPAFEFKLGEVATFPNGLIHVPPEPAAPFAELTALLAADFPECPPYAGEFVPVPHLTLDQTAPGVTEDSVRAALGPTIPVTCRAERLEVHWYAEGDCRVLASWPFGSAAGQ